MPTAILPRIDSYRKKMRRLNYLKLPKVLFLRLKCRLFYAPFFKSIGPKTYIEKPYEITGAKYIQIGRSSVILQSARLCTYEAKGKHGSLNIGNHVAIGFNCHIACGLDITIEDNVLIADKVFLTDMSHEYADIQTPIRDQGLVPKSPLVLGRGSWVGENAVIMGAQFGKNCVIGANSVVAGGVYPDYSIVAGIPARLIKRYDPLQQAWIKA